MGTNTETAQDDCAVGVVSMDAELGAFVSVLAREQCCSEERVLQDLVSAGARVYGF